MKSAPMSPTQLIDFDDSGFGFRLFDIATTLLRNRTEPDYAGLKNALLNGYLSVCTLDFARFDLYFGAACRLLCGLDHLSHARGGVGGAKRPIRRNRSRSGRLLHFQKGRLT